MLERGQLPKGQFVDAVAEGPPPQVEDSVRQAQVDARARSAAEVVAEQRRAEASAETISATELRHSLPADVEGHPVVRTRTEDYGPFRRVRHSYKSPPEYLRRPPNMALEDFSEALHDLMSQPGVMQSVMQTTSPRGESSKREASSDAADERQSARPRLETPTDAPEDELLLTEALCAEHLEENKGATFVEALTAAFIQKRASKEIPAYGNPPELQKDIDASKAVEWETVHGKQATRVWRGKQAEDIRQTFPHRFVGSRFVVIQKTDEEGTRIKSRWCLLGHLDPDFGEKVNSGVCHSPTRHPLSRAVILQILASKKWVLQLGDVKGAFLEAGPLQAKYSPLYAKQPPGGVPGLHPDDVIEVIGNVYGPFKWYNTFDEYTRQVGFRRSQFDSCLYSLRDAEKNLCGVLGAHVDDTIAGGSGEQYEKAIQALKARFPYRKRRIRSGEFCGAQYQQCAETHEITYKQTEYARHMRPINMSKERQRNKEALVDEREISALRAINGAANWLSSQSRRDLASQTDFLLATVVSSTKNQRLGLCKPVGSSSQAVQSCRSDN